MSSSLSVQLIDKGLCGGVREAFGLLNGTVTGRYSASSVDIAPEKSPSKSLRFNLNAWGSDLIHSLVLKFERSGACTPQNFCESIEVDKGGINHFWISRERNECIARARGRWPCWANDVLGTETDSRNLVAVPVMENGIHITRTTLWHNQFLTVTGVHPDCRDLRLCVEQVCVDSAVRKALIDVTNVQSQPTRPDPIYKAHADTRLHRSYETSSSEIDGKFASYKIKIDESPTLTHLIVTLKTDKPVLQGSHPVGRLCVKLMEQTIQDYDHVDLNELNWLRCGLISPMGETKRRETYSDTFVYLVPMSREAFRDQPTCWIDMTRVDGKMTVEIKGYRGANVPAGRVEIMYDFLNILVYKFGMVGLQFSR
jgi:hypothetical protein